MTAYSLTVAAHALIGTVALLTFWTAGLMKKGTPLHRRVGQVYLLAMCGIVATGLPLVFAALERGAPVAAMFLGFLLLLVSAGCWNAWQAIRRRHDRRRYFGLVYWVFAALLGLCGSGMVALGIDAGSMLVSVFGGVGLLAAIDSVRNWRRSPADPKWWLREHYSAMIGNGVATHIAFLGIGLRNAIPGLDPQLQQHIAWFGPLVVALVAGGWLNRKYGRKPVRRAAAAGPRHVAG